MSSLAALLFALAFCASSVLAQGQASLERWIVEFDSAVAERSEIAKALRSSGTSASTTSSGTSQAQASPNKPQARDRSVATRFAAELDARAERVRAAFGSRVRELGGHVDRLYWIVDAAAIRVPPPAVATLRSFPGVKAIHPDRLLRPLIKTATDNAHHAADSTQARGFAGQGATIAILDTGQDDTLAGRCPVSNPYPQRPITRPLSVSRTEVIRHVASSTLVVTGFELWCSDLAQRNVRAVVMSDNNGVPGQVLAAATLRPSRTPGFAVANLSTRLRFAPNTAFYFGIVTPSRSTLRVELPSGSTSVLYTGAGARWTRRNAKLGWKLRCSNLAAHTPHPTYLDPRQPRPSRIVVSTSLGKLSANSVELHGTAVASVAAGANWGPSVADHGHAPLAKIAAYALADTSSGATLSSTAIHAFEVVLCDLMWLDIDVVSFAYSGSSNPLDLVQRALDAAAWHGDLTIVAPTGSGGGLSGTNAAVNGLSVGSASTTKTVSRFSGRGVAAGGVYPDLVAHGESVVMARAGQPTGSYTASGTSLACAQVAGAATMIHGAARGGGIDLGANEARAILLASTQASPGTASSPRSGPGCGYLRNDAALDIALAKKQHGSERITKTRTTLRWTLRCVRGRRYQFAIAWMRKRFASLALSNIDLSVYDGARRLIAASRQASSSEEFVRFTAPTSGLFSVEAVGTRLVEDVVKIAWASSSPLDNFSPPVSRYSEFDTGCKGSGTGGGCPALKQDPKNLDNCPGLPPKTTYALLVQCPCSVTIKGFSLYLKSSQPNTPVDCYLFKSVGLQPELFASRTQAGVSVGGMVVGTTAQHYTVTFSSPLVLSASEAENFFLGFTTPGDATLWADNGTSKQGHHFMRATDEFFWTGGGGFQGAITEISWDWKTQCTPGAGCPGGPPPDLGAIGLPAIGNSNFVVTLDNAGTAPVAVCGTGGPGRCISLRPAGAQACFLCTIPISYLPVAIQRGSARLPFPIPRDARLAGVEFWQQWIVFDQKANKLGLTLSGPGKALVGY